MNVLARSPRLRKVPRGAVAALVSLALLATGMEATEANAEPLADAKPVAAPPAKVTSRPDVVSAAVTARSQGSRVEVESMRTETSTTWSNPDGTMTTEAHAAPIRFKSGGVWKDVDLTLQKGIDGSVAPRAQQHGLRLGKRNAATGQVFASADSGPGKTVEWISPWKLPEPTLDGTKATYAEVQPGVDLVLDARRNGFENDFIVKQRPAVAPVWRIPLRTKGLTAKAQKDGSIAFVDAKNVVRSTIPVGDMWDSASAKTTVKVTVEQVSAGKATLVIAPDAKWFLDPARQFPVTVDPTYASGATYANFDTFVQSDVSGDQSANTELRVGKTPTGVARSFLNFDTAPFKGKDIVSSWLNIWQHTSASCTPSAVNVRSTMTLATTATRWANQPALGTVYGSLSAAKGFSTACPGGRIIIPITPLAKAWSNATYTVGGLALVAANEADANSWKEFYSTTGSKDPVIGITWNRPPAKPATVTPTDAVSYAAPGDTTSWLYTNNLHPWVTTKATDPDGNTVKYIYEFYTGSGDTFSVKGTCTTHVYASGTVAGCSPAETLPDNTQLYVRVKANDGRVDGPWVGYNTRLRTGAAVPSQPTVSCPAPYNNNDSWQDNPPTADVTCTVTATGAGYNAPGYLRLIVDGKQPATNFTGGAAGQIKITPSSDPNVAKFPVTFSKDTPGLHTIVVQAQTPAGTLSSNATYKFGWGGTSLTSPAANPRTTTMSTVRVTAAGPPKGLASSVTAKVKWRISGYGSADDLVGWNEDPTALTVTDSGAGGVSVNTQWDSTTAKVDAFLDSDPNTDGIQPTTLNDRVPVLLDVQVCFKYGTTEQCTWSQTPNTTIQRVPHAFGNGFPTADAGPGQVALWTGEFNTEATDVSVPGYTGDLSISRAHSTYSAPTNNIDGAFGPGWVGQFDGAEAGAAGMRVIDSTQIDGTIALVDGDGSTLVFTSPTGKRRTTDVFDAGTWVPADEDTEVDGSKLTITGTATDPVLSYIEDDGTVTAWNASERPFPTRPTVFRPTTIGEPGIATKTTYAYDSDGRVARILAPTGPGVTCAAYNPTQPLVGMTPGCRALHFKYTLIGSSQTRLTEAWLDIYNPDKTGGAGMESIQVAAYSYDTNGRLAKVTDPRSNLSTEYTYNAADHLTSVKSAGQTAYQLNYVTADGREELDAVKRDRPTGDPSGGTATLAKVVYDVPLSGAGLPDLTSGSVGRWNQKTAPTKGFAVFGPDHPVSGTPGSDDWQYADLQYTDAAGYTVNTAKYGAGDWQYTSTDYNELGNVSRELDERALRTVIDNAVPAGASADQLATVNVYNADIKNAAGDAVVTPAGTLVTDSYGPSRFATVKDGSTKWVRTHTHTQFDELAPNSGINPATTLPYRLATTVTTGAFDPGAGTEEPLTRSQTDYDPAVSGDPSGWALGQPSKTTTDANPAGPRNDVTADIVKVTRYDAEGRVIDSRQPNSNGADAGTTRTVYYTAAANSQYPECGLKPQWGGLTCKVYPAAAPTNGGTATPTLPTTTTSNFTYLLAPKTVIETSGAVTRTSTTSYLLDGRSQNTKTTVTGLSGSAPNTAKTTTYDPATGQATVVTATAADNTTTNVTTGYDSWGRQTSYQPQGDPATTTVYDASGQVATVTDSNGSTRYTYDGTDAAGKTEHRGLATKIEVTTAGSTWTSSGAYDADGSMTTQKLPGGITQSTDYDNAGEPTGLRYTGQVTTTNEDGSTTVDPDGPWLSWSVDNDVTGRVVHEWTPDGNAFTGSTGDAPGDAVGYDRGYSYDSLGRLTKVEDRTAATTGVDVTDPTQLPGCVTRTYGFDRNDNRLTKATAAPATDGSCTTSGAVPTNRAFDTADRPTTGANGTGSYVYDALGRTTTLPASDAPKSADGNITIGYYDNDLPRWITQAGTTTTFSLDALDRRSVETATTSSGSTDTIRHYTDTSDNPTWVAEGTTTQRYVELIGGDLSLTVDQTGKASLPIANTHGDTVTTIDLTGTQPATSIGAWSNYDEYGQTTSKPSTGPVDYGWLGGKQRATSATGLVLMGVRLYNSATGLFTSVDPVDGGNANAYTYPTDPINSFDLDGNFGWKKFWHRAATVTGIAAAVVCVVATAGACGVAIGASLIASAGWNAYQYRHGSISRRTAFTNFGIDAVGALFKPIRGFKYASRHRYAIRGAGRFAGRLGRHRGGFKHRVNFGRHIRHWGWSVRRKPWRAAAVFGVNGYYGHRSWKNGW